MGEGISPSDEDVTPVFGLTRSQLQPIVQSIAGGEHVASFEIDVEADAKKNYGTRGQKLAATLTCTTHSGEERRVALFVKRPGSPGPREAHHYAELAKHSAPIPLMYGALTDSDGYEVVFLERVDPVAERGDFVDDAEVCHEFLSVLARFNAVRPSGEYAARLRRSDPRKGLAGAESALDLVWGHATKGELGDAFRRLCAGHEDGLGRLKDTVKRLVDRVAEMKRGLCHGDPMPCNVARRRKTGALLLVDLESVGLGVRFSDAAWHLGAADDVQTRCRPREELAEYYLEQYVQHGGEPVPVAQFLEETRVAWMAQSFIIIPAWCGNAMHKQDDPKREDIRLKIRDRLHGELRCLLREAT